MSSNVKTNKLVITGVFSKRTGFGRTGCPSAANVHFMKSLQNDFLFYILLIMQLLKMNSGTNHDLNY